jgi:HAMP domain-containing protein
VSTREQYFALLDRYRNLMAERDRLVDAIHRLRAAIRFENARIGRKIQEMQRLRFQLYQMVMRGVPTVEQLREYEELERRIEAMERDYYAEREKVSRMSDQLFQLGEQLNRVVEKIRRVQASLWGAVR